MVSECSWHFLVLGITFGKAVSDVVRATSCLDLPTGLSSRQLCRSGPWNSQAACSHFLLQIWTLKPTRLTVYLKGGFHLHFQIQELPRFCLLLKHPHNLWQSAVLLCIEAKGCRDPESSRVGCMSLSSLGHKGCAFSVG